MAFVGIVTLSALLALSVVMAWMPAEGVAQVAVFDVPFQDQGPDLVGTVVRASAVGEPDPRITRLSARRLSARRRGEGRARASIHRWADDALAAARASAMTADAVHRAIDEAAVVVGRRPLVAGETVVVVDMPLEDLRRAARVPGAPWAP